MNGPTGSLIPILLLLGTITLWWLSAMHARDRARDAARRFCERQNWQLLDQTVSLTRMRPRRSEQGWALHRTFRFEFSPDGGARSSGGLNMIGSQAVRIWADGADGGLIDDTGAQ